MKRIAYVIADGRKVSVEFITKGRITRVKTEFEPENENPIQMQREGWQAILNSFKKYAESKR